MDYYLTGSGVDSLPTLLEQTTEEESTVNPVTGYLLCLCVKEIYESRELVTHRLVKRHLRQVKRYIRDYVSSDQIKLEDNSPAKRKAFFRWFEDQFFKVYRVKEAEV